MLSFQILLNLKSYFLFVILYSLVIMTVLCSYSSNIVGNEFNFSAQAQVIGSSQLPPSASPTTSLQTGTLPAVKITSHSNGQQVNVGPLTISGTSSDTPLTTCEVYADWNDNKPFGKARAAGPGGPTDYSTWTFTYDSTYHLIQNGTNNLTSKISCVDGPTASTKWNSIDLIGVSDSGPTIDQAITTGPPQSSPSPPSGLTESPFSPFFPTTQLDPIVGNEEEDEEDEEDSDSDVSSEDNEEENNEDEDEDNDEASGMDDS
jgi:hypothetical protein